MNFQEAGLDKFFDRHAQPGRSLEQGFLLSSNVNNSARSPWATAVRRVLNAQRRLAHTGGAQQQERWCPARDRRPAGRRFP